eukprot:1154465-Pelagomonas_calceolata.AAC.2
MHPWQQVTTLARQVRLIKRERAALSFLDVRWPGWLRAVCIRCIHVGEQGELRPKHWATAP